VGSLIVKNSRGEPEHDDIMRTSRGSFREASDPMNVHENELLRKSSNGGREGYEK